MINNDIDTSILTEISKEKFKRKIAIIRIILTRGIAIALVLAILWIGYIQIDYAKEVSSIKEKYGANGFCYLCGKESLKSCSCTYSNDPNLNITALSESLALANVEVCLAKDLSVTNRNFPLIFNST